jgi:RimJ/RimL family protein N-acetyltransferase
MNNIELRNIIESDLQIFFEQQKEKESIWMAAFISRDPENREEFNKHWDKIRNNDSILIKTILYNDNVAGNIVSFMMDEHREVGYWIGKEYWGNGIATDALKIFVNEIRIRPLFAHVAFDNIGSIKVLEKCGFERIGEDKYFAKARQKEITEYIFRLDK